MTEKVLHEVRFIETDDGFRIEVKGDKEKIRQMGFGPVMGMMGFGPGMMRHKRHHRHGRHHHDHEGHRHGRSGWGWWWDNSGETEEPDFEIKEKSPEDI
ncbi:MAG: hypothetical protein H6667_12095 [Ardenticatenaceae bacterium]|nr:hypothetical protein [Ardenticatenaceae bacterium]